MARLGSTKVTVLDWVVVGAGVLAYVSSFLPWYRVSVSVPLLDIERSDGANAWNAGVGAWLSVVLLLLAGAVVLASTMSVRLAASRPLIALGLSVLAAVTILLRWATYPDAGGGRGELGDLDLGSAFSASSGADLGLYLGLVAAIAAVVASLLALASKRNAPPDRSV